MNTEYWYVGSYDGGYKVDRETYQVIKEAIRSHQQWVDFEDIFGAKCGLIVKHITDWHHSTEEARQKHIEFNKLLEKEKEEKPEWER